MHKPSRTRSMAWLVSGLCLTLLIGGCATSRQTRNMSSAVEFLYPDYRRTR